jgi:hypothetical protein
MTPMIMANAKSRYTMAAHRNPRNYVAVSPILVVRIRPFDRLPREIVVIVFFRTSASRQGRQACKRGLRHRYPTSKVSVPAP